MQQMIKQLVESKKHRHKCQRCQIGQNTEEKPQMQFSVQGCSTLKRIPNDAEPSREMMFLCFGKYLTAQR